MSVINLVRGAVTVSLTILFILLWWRAWSRQRREEYAAAAQMPLMDDGNLPGGR